LTLSTEDETGADFWAQRLATAHATRVDGTSTAYLKELIQTIDWVDQTTYGEAVSNHAWLLVQHADNHVDLQREVLKRMEPLLANDEVSAKNYAYLWDRVAVNEDRKQRYGTQPTWECTDGQLTLKPLEDPEGVNPRRAKMGLNTVEEGLAEMSNSVCR